MWSMTGVASAGEEGECSRWDVLEGPAGDHRGPGARDLEPGSAALGAVKSAIKVPYPPLFRLCKI